MTGVLGRRNVILLANVILLVVLKCGTVALDVELPYSNFLILTHPSKVGAVTHKSVIVQSIDCQNLRFIKNTFYPHTSMQCVSVMTRLKPCAPMLVTGWGRKSMLC